MKNNPTLAECVNEAFGQPINEFYSQEAVAGFASLIASTFGVQNEGNIIKFTDDKTMMEAAKAINTHVNRRYTIDTDNRSITISQNESNAGSINEGFGDIQFVDKFKINVEQDTEGEYCVEAMGAFAPVKFKAIAYAVPSAGDAYKVAVDIVYQDFNKKLVKRLETGLSYFTGDEATDNANMQAGYDLLKKEGKKVVDKIIKSFKSLDASIRKA